MPGTVGQQEVFNVEQMYLCKQCRHVFKQVIPGNSSSDGEIHCPACCSSDVMEAPPWAPLGSGLNIFESNIWEYECQQCQHKFKMTIPKSPAEGKSRRCPACNSGHLHVLTIKGGLPLYCG
jgi:DNA-directed RNA polymerase subunit RPC12/RpoP